MLLASGAMRHTLLLAWLLLLPGAALAQAPVQQPPSDSPGERGWNRVLNLERGAPIVVKAVSGQTAHCLFAGATQNMLLCDGGYTKSERLDREEVAEIRRWPGRGRMHRIVGGAAAIGFVAGAATPNANGNTYPWVVRGLGGSLLGALAGCAVAIPAQFFPGPLVYRRPHASTAD